MVYRDHVDIPPLLRKLKQFAREDGFPGLHIPIGHYATHPVLLPRKRDRGENKTLTTMDEVFDRMSNYPFPYPWMRGGRDPMEVPSWCFKKESMGEPRLDNVIGIATSFDNTPRRAFSKARMWIGRQGEKGILWNWQRNLWAAFHYHACCFAEGGTNQFILINAWNEWAEGMALEPSDVYRNRFLQILKFTKHYRFETCGISKTPPYKLAYKANQEERDNVTNWDDLTTL
jgi:hypothetical protein